jgi:hypothetical protein
MKRALVRESRTLIKLLYPRTGGPTTNVTSSHSESYQVYLQTSQKGAATWGLSHSPPESNRALDDFLMVCGYWCVSFVDLRIVTNCSIFTANPRVR